MRHWSYYINAYYQYTHGSFNIDNEIIFQILYNCFCKNNNCRAQKSKPIPKIKCTIILEQLYCINYNTRPKNAPKGVIVMCFHPAYVIITFS